MKLVIDIPAEQYESVMNGTWCVPLYEELKNGVAVEPCTDCVSRKDAVRIAGIHSLPVDECVNMLKALPSVTPVPKTSDDCISRQAAKSKAVYSHERHERVVPVAELDWLPSVEPEYGKLMKYNVGGHDACKCSKCNTDLGYPYEGKFCKWCGAKMMEVDE